MLRPEIEALLLELAHKHYQGARLAEELDRQARRRLRPRRAATGRPLPPPDAEALADLAAWARQELGRRDRPPTSSASSRPRRGPRPAASTPSTPSTGPRCARWRRCSLLQILDSSWMEHLRAMDHLRSSIGLQGYAQIDPKVEYKREGMKIFDEMWNGVADKVTDLIFRVEQFDPEFLSYLGIALAARPGADDPPVGRRRSSPPSRPAGGGIRQPAGRRHRRQPASGREEARAGPQRWKKGGSERPLPVRIG